ncbi:FHA domain-containing protein FhaB/FipA [Amnibacterium kyonggiense]|uniref:Type III secretion system (T3SS) inner membrane Yop/YscD-like protein n=1 Tax=Amnibacterium kyonggiense TaxID=595671 RepID=A0A4R7FQ47_9MICO|nr:FHA domain-containing protein [Amnibacterium kyonggiense]TDS79806.1 type III secretion system (T3SS) inner membrane Yop/YscD-like protein [Amnibacterium kyonggiense]
MSELTLLVLRVAFLLLLWVFVFAVVYSLRSDLFGGRVRRVPEGAAPPAPAPASTPPAVQSLPSPPTPGGGARVHQGPASVLVITSGGKAGLEIPLGTEPLMIGRASDAGLQIRDDYTSTHHARLLLWGSDWVIQDLDSTNGTFVDGARIDSPTQVPVGVSVKVGATTFELRG